jgi:hypothetical protein
MDDKIINLIDENNWIVPETRNEPDPHSFSTLVDEPLTQSQCIKLGNLMEQTIEKIVTRLNIDWKPIKVKAKKGEKDTDHLFKNDLTKQIIWTEQKNNINLDSEKTKITDKKGDDKSHLQELYPGYDIKYNILAARYLSTSEPFAQQMTKKFTTPVVGINDYFDIFGLPKFTTYDQYKRVIKTIVTKAFRTPLKCS